MRTRSERELYIGNFELTRILHSFGELISGFLLSALSPGGMQPFGLAYSTVAGNFGVVGVLLGYFFFSEDAYRYVFAVLFCFILRRLLSKKLPLSAAVNGFFFSVWGTLMAELLGVITVKYSFTENMLFALSGLLSGVISVAYLFSGGKPKRTTADMRNVMLFCRAVFIGSLLAGVASFDGVFVYSAYVLALLTVFVLGRHAGLLKTFTVGLTVAVFFLLTGLFPFSMLGCIVAAVAVAGLLREFPPYLTSAACIISAILILIYEQGSFLAWTNMLCVLISSVVYVALPTGATLLAAKTLLPKALPVGAKVKGRRRAYKTSDIVDINPVCDGCSRKFICWVRDHDYTADIFIKLKNSDFTDIPAHFEEHCSRISELTSVLARPKTNGACSKMLFSKAGATKRGEKACGDNAAYFSVGEGRYVVCILDGMGSGLAASKDSAACSELLKKLLVGGVDKKEAVRFLNERLMSEKRERILGADIMTVDLNSGYMDTCKAGAAPTYIIRNGKIYEFGSVSLPIGVLDDVQVETDRCRICVGDIIVMVSDGFSERGGEWLGRRLFDRVSAGSVSCMEISESLINDACEDGLDIYDDLTVVAVKIL